MDRVSQPHECFMLIFIFSSVGLRLPASGICSINYMKGYELKSEKMWGGEKNSQIKLEFFKKQISLLARLKVFTFSTAALDTVT